MMGRPYGSGRVTCESCISIDVRRWHREGRLRPGLFFSWSWTCNGEPFGDIKVRTEADAVVLMYRARSYGGAEWKSVEQRVPITWTACHLGGHRPWFICSVYSNGRYCGRRVALLYIAGELFACRRCYGLAYASQHEALHHRGVGKAQKIRMRLGGSPNMREAFPDKPKGMHWRTYDRLRRMHDVAEGRSAVDLMRLVERLERRFARLTGADSANDFDNSGGEESDHDY
ncbi:MAG TPA: hypothetical protein VM910_29300 [Bradyrhizobium sp.]|nr:hypothetical protein [Bradyrhizobium sp.]